LFGIVDAEFDLLLVGSQERELPESHMERRACQRSILLFHNYDIDSTAKGGRV
jgi:hypothetical protein